MSSRMLSLLLALTSILAVTTAHAEVAPYFVKCDSTTFDTRSGQFYSWFKYDAEKENPAIEQFLDQMQVPIADRFRNKSYKLYVAFDPASCVSPQNPYAFDGAGCTRLNEVKLLGSRSSYGAQGSFTYEYLLRDADASILTSVVAVRDNRGRKFEGVRLFLRVNGSELPYTFDNFCGSPCTRNNVVQFPAFIPTDFDCNASGL